MDYFYDGQLRRYVTQFMRVFIGFKWKAGNGDEQQVPVMYGDMTRQVAAIIKENSENKLSSVPKIACYISGLEMDTSRLSDASFVSKVNIRERRYTDADNNGSVEYQNVQGGNYTVERLMPTPYKLSMKAEIWTSNTDQKLQLLEQILVLFNPSLEIQTTDNYIDWTSLSVIDITSLNFSSRTIPQGAETDIDICSLEFSMPVFISPPSKVKRLGVVQTVISNVFTETGDIINLEDLVYNKRKGSFDVISNRYRVLLFKSNTGNLEDNFYDLTLVNSDAAVLSLGLDQKDYKNGEPVDWNAILEVQGGHTPSSQAFFKQATGLDIVGTFTINPIDPTILVVEVNPDTIPGNTAIAPVDPAVLGRRLSGDSAGTIDAIIDPYKYDPLEVYGSHSAIPLGLRFLMLDDVNPSSNRGGLIDRGNMDPTDGSSRDRYDGPDAWKNSDLSDPLIKANSIIEWDGSNWTTVWDPVNGIIPTYIQNLRTGIKYRWDGEQWLKAFEGEYAPGYWGFVLDPQ
jgi:hypothetical protein